MRTGTACPWCQRLAYAGLGAWPYCRHCWHRADQPRQLCICPKCRPTTVLVDELPAERR